jgi:hypothetical protein
LQKVLRAYARGTTFFEDVNNRDESMRILQAASGLKKEDVEKGYDFQRNGHYFDTTGKVSRAKADKSREGYGRRWAIFRARSTSIACFCRA